MTLRNVTLASNTSSSSGADAAGLNIVGGAPTTLVNSIIASNSNAAGARDCNGSVTSSGNNLSGSAQCPFENAGIGDQEGVAVLLGPLQDNGGATFTHLPLVGSPAIDTGSSAAPGSGGNACEATDQRGTVRPHNGDDAGAAICDKGAVEAPNLCNPRPAVSVTVTPISGNLIRATVTAGAGVISSVHLGMPDPMLNARVNVQGGPQDLTGTFLYNGASSPALPPSTTQLVLDIRQQSFGSGTSVPIIVSDQCGAWPTLAGGGTGVFTLPPPASAGIATPTITSAPLAAVAPTPGAACARFATHAAAQAHLRANPSDPLLLDRSRNGVACEGADGAGFVNPPLDHVPVPRP
jgi:hypothetical protein